MITGIAHTAICVADIDAAVAWYVDILGLQLLSPPYLMEGETIERDMGELVPSPVAIKAAIVGIEPGDRVLELIEYPNIPTSSHEPHRVIDPGITHVGLVCGEIDATRTALESLGVEFLTTDTASIAGLRTTWFRDPFGVVFILMEKGHADRAYWHQFA